VKPKLYLETSIVSYLTARPSHDLIRAAHQQITRDWWEMRSSFGMPAKAYADAVHVAVAAVHGMDYLLTWNCTHIANAAMRGKIESICRATDFEPPVICTPVELVKEL
jgi:hypothetical protein